MLKKLFKKQHPLKEAICEVLGTDDINLLSENIQIGIAWMLIRYRESVTGEIEAPSIVHYLENAGIESSSASLQNAMTVIEENHLIKDGKINLTEGEDIEHPVVWGMLGSLFEGHLIRKVENGEARYKLSDVGTKYVEQLLGKSFDELQQD